MTTRVRRPVAATVEELVADATSRTPMSPVDGLSAVPMERVVIGGERYVLKRLSRDLDWIMRVTDDTDCWAVLMWEHGLYDAVSTWVDPLVVAAAREASGLCAVLMRDATEEFLAEGAAPIAPEQQAVFLRDMAALHAGMWGFVDDVGLCGQRQVYYALSVESMSREAALGLHDGVPAYVAPGWEVVRAIEPELTERVIAVGNHPSALAAALAQTPHTFGHRDWKGGNLGIGRHGRTILVDWAIPGASAGCVDLAWYLGVNCDRLPTSKEAAIETYRSALEREGIDTRGWFDRQLDLALLGAFAQLGWSKPDNPAELRWWVDRVRATAHELTV